MKEIASKKILAQISRFCFLLVLFSLPITVKSQGSAPANRASGSPVGSYKLGDFDTVNLYGGGLNFNLPLFNAHGRGEVSQDLSLTLQTQWGSTRTESVNGDIDYNLQPYTANRLASVGYLTAVGDDASIDYQSPCNSGDGTIYYPISHQLYMIFVEPDGTEHKLVDRYYRGRPFTRCGDLNINYGKIFESVGGEFISYISDSDVRTQSFALNGYLYFKNGIKSRIENGKIIWSLDRNGNKIEYTYHPNYNLPFHIPRPIKIKDSIGREVNIEYDVNDSAPYGLCDRLIYKGIGGQDRIIRITKDWLHDNLRTTQPSDPSTVKTMGELFPVPSNGYTTISNPSTVFDTYIIKAVWLPDGRKYQFKYSVYGRLARTELPTGGAVEYDFEPSADSIGNYDTVINRVNEKRIYNTNLESKTVFTRTVTTNGFPSATAGTVVDVETFDGSDQRLSKNRHFFYSVANSEYSYNLRWSDGKEFKTEAFASDGTTLLRRVKMNWQQRIPSWCYNNPYLGNAACGSQPSVMMPVNNPMIVENEETLADGNLIKLTSSINPTNGQWAFDDFNNSTDIWEYDYGAGQPGTFKRRTHTDFVSDTNYTSYSGSHLRSLPSQTWISSDAGGTNKISLTQFEYDNFSSGGNYANLTTRSNVVGHDSTSYDTTFTRRGNVTKVTSYENAANQTGAISVYSQYDILGNVVKAIDGKGYSTTIDYSDRFGSPDGEAQSNTTPTYLNAQSNLVYPLNGLSTFAFPTSGTNAMNWIVGYAQFDYFTGQSVNVEDLNGVISKTIYNDALDRPTQAVTAVGTAFERQSNIIYDDANKRIETKSDLNALNDNLLKAESFYDGLGRTVKSRKYEADGSYIIVETIPFMMMQDPETSQWRAASKVSNPYRSTDTGQPVWTTSLSDELGRTTKVITPDNAIVKTEYSGNAVTVTDQAGKKRRSITNALGQLTRVDEPDSAGNLGSVGSPNQPTNYTYDVLNNLLTVSQIGTTSEQCGGSTSSCTQTRTFLYDSLSRLQSATNPEAGLIQYQYDNNGNLTNKTDARGVQTSYAYDALNRVTLRSYASEPSGQLPTPSVAYTYDNVTNAKGKLTKVTTTGTGTNTFTAATEYQAFDQMGRVTQSQQKVDGVAYGVSAQLYKYNLSGALIEQTYPSGRVVKNVLDNEGDLAIVQSKKNANAGYWNYAKSFTYTAAGAVSSMQLGNGKWESTVFNSRLQPTQIALGGTQNATDLLKLNFAYNTTTNNVANADNNGNVLSQTITVPSETRNSTTYSAFTATQTYTYDALNRLHSAEETIPSQTGWKQTFKYDRYGNRNFDYGTNSSNPDTTTPNGQTNLPKVVNPEVLTTNNRFKQDQDNDSTPDYLYDASGNLTRDVNYKKFTYDGENHQTKAETVDSYGNITGTLGTYYYDGDGKRVKKVSAIETTIFIYDASGKLVAEYANQTATTPQVSYLTADHLGSPRINTDANGQVISRHDYQPFGEEIYPISGNTARMDYSTDEVRKQFTSYERDIEADLDYAQARYYNFNQGRFTSVDPFLASATTGNPQSFNRYIYVLNNPLALIDRTGGFPEYTFSVYVRAFAPFEWFGPGDTARGDNRGFSTDPNASYRTQAFSEVRAGSGDYFTMSVTRASPPSLSETNLGFYSWTAYSECYINDTNGNYFPDGLPGEGNSLAYHMYGNDDAIPFVSGNIDLHPDFTFSHADQGNGVDDMTIAGTVTGDQFPAAEAFVRDSRGNSVMLGVFAPVSSSGPVGSLPLNGTSPMINVNVTVRVNNGVFQGVVENGNVISLDEYNRRFTSQPAVRPNQ